MRLAIASGVDADDVSHYIPFANEHVAQSWQEDGWEVVSCCDRDRTYYVDRRVQSRDATCLACLVRVSIYR